MTSFYWDNLYSFGLAPKKGADGQYEWTFPMGDSKLAGIAAEDIGKVAYGIFKAGQQYVGKTVGILGENLTISRDGREDLEGDGRRPDPLQRRRRGCSIAASDSPAPTKWATCSRCTATSRRKCLAARSADVARQLNPQLQNFDQFLAKNKSKIEPAMNPAPARS